MTHARSQTFKRVTHAHHSNSLRTGARQSMVRHERYQVNMAQLLLHLAFLGLIFFVAVSLDHAASHAHPSTDSSSSSSVPRVDVVLVGATSSLARKYLFQSFFRSYLEEELKPLDDPTKVRLRLYGAATRAPEEGVGLLKQYLEGSTSCKGVGGLSPAACEAKLAEYRRDFEYVQLRGEAQYAELGRKLRQAEEEQQRQQGAGPLAGRLFYLAISPDLYPSVAKSIGDHTRPVTQGAWLRVVFEKPFGRDLPSAERLAAELAAHLAEEEIYRVDHYMGKTAVQAILPFRHANRDWLDSAVWNAEHVARLEVAMKETEDCEGRTSFYEGYGVIRDVLQNHLTQVLVLLKMDLPHDAAPERDVYGTGGHRTNVLRELRLHGGDANSRATIRVGQYEGYHGHVAADRRVAEPHFVKTTVPTAASVTLGSAHPRWAGVEFVLKAGKALDARTSYAKATLRGGPLDEEGRPCELLFNIQGGPLGTAIAWNTTACAGLLDPRAVRVPVGWVASDGDGAEGGLHVLRPAAGAAAPNAYDVVVEEVLEGDRGMFLGTEELLHQWKVWDQVLRHADKMEPAIYPLGFDIDEIEAIGVIGAEEEEDEGGREEL